MPPPGSPPSCRAWLHRRRDGGFHLALRAPDGRLLPGSPPADPGRPVTLWPERRSRPQGDPAEAIARAEAIQARRAHPRVDDVEAWRPPAVLRVPRLPKTGGGTRRLLGKLARRKRRFEMIQMADPAVEMPRVPASDPVSFEEGKRILEERYRLAVLRARYLDASDEALALL